MKTSTLQTIAGSLCLLAVATFPPALSAATESKEKVLYVSPTGSDTAKGTAKSPFQTLEHARDEIRKLKADGASGPFVVELLPGRYLLEKSFVLTEEDSGSAKAPIIYRAQKKGTASLIGAKIVKLADCEKVTDPALLDRLDPSARENVVTFSAEKLGLVHAGPFPDKFDDQGGLFELFDPEGRMPLSRWPNTGYTTMKKTLVNGDKNTPGSFEYRDDRTARWTNALPNVWLRGQWRVGWQDPALRVAAIDTTAKTITFGVGLDAGIGSKYKRPEGSGEEPWCAINLMEEIDKPGEWSIDFATHQVYVWPRKTGEDATLIVTQTDQPLISGTNLSNVRFENLVMEHSLGDGFILEKADGVKIAGCEIQNIGSRGVVLNGVNSSVESCDIHDVGRGAIYISGGDRKTLTHSKNEIVNNHLYHYGAVKRQYSAAVHVGVMESNGGADMLRDAVGIHIAHNVVHHAPRDAFLYSGNDNIYEYNEIYYCAFDTKDTGAFYSWRDWTMRGNIIRYNYIHDTIGGVNPDDGASGNIVYGNVFKGASIGVWIASGPDNSIKHNIFIKEEGSVFGMDDRGVSRKYATNKSLINRVLEIKPTEEPWKSAHPEMATLLESHPELPLRTEFIGNLIVSQKPAPSSIKMSGSNKANPDLLTEKDNLVVSEDPGFVDAAAGNYALKPESEVFQKIPDFKPIPFEKIGLYKDKFRPELPTKEEYQRGPEYDPYPKNLEKSFST